MFDTQVCVCRERGRASHLDLASPSMRRGASGARSPAEAEAQQSAPNCHVPNSRVLVLGKPDRCATTGAAAPLIMMMVDHILTSRAISARQMKSARRADAPQKGDGSCYLRGCAEGFEPAVPLEIITPGVAQKNSGHFRLKKHQCTLLLQSHPNMAYGVGSGGA